MGKGWAKGRTAATDPRIARAAAGHRGKAYVRRTPVEDCRWPVSTSTTLPLEWSHEMAYVVGLTATDGCLITGRRAINFKSSDRDLVALYLSLLGRTNRIGTERTRGGGLAYKTQFSDARLYRWFMEAGLTPRKSLTLGALAVPAGLVVPLARGLFDGDGTIMNKIYRADTKSRTPYLWEYLITRFYSASKTHVEWLQSMLQSALQIEGRVAPFAISSAGNTEWGLCFGKRESVKLLAALYQDAAAPSLQRKRAIWGSYLARHPLA